MAQCRDCGKEYDGSSEPGLCSVCMPKWLKSAQATADDYAHQWQQERMRAERLADINRDLLAACEALVKAMDSTEWDNWLQKLVDAAYDAVAKAKGHE